MTASAEVTLGFRARTAFANEQRQAWLLTLFGAADRVGILPLGLTRLHHLIYIANCLAPAYDIAGLDQTVLKGRRGPFYPQVQWDLDELVVRGLVEMSRFEITEDAAGVWFNADYSLDPRGLRVSNQVLHIPAYLEVFDYLSELSAAFEPYADRFVERVRAADANYSIPGTVDGMLLDFGEWVEPSERNFAYRTTLSFDYQRPQPFSRRDRLHLYIRYLLRVGRRG
jgi:hypothetical protein